MSVRIHGGVGFSTYSGARYIDLGAMASEADASKLPSRTIPDEKSGDTNSWAQWGTNNMLPIEMVDYIETCGILSGIIDHQARFALGEGVQWAFVRRDNNGKLIVEEMADVPEITEFMEMNNHYYHEFGWMKDQVGLANGVVRFSLDKPKNKIALFQRDDVSEMRYKRMNDSGQITHIYLSAQWDNIKAEKPDGKTLIEVPLLDYRMPLADLIKRKTSFSNFAHTFRYPSWGKKYYSLPLWWANLKWVKIARSVPDMKAAMYENSMRPKYLITIYQEFWEQLFIGEGPGQKPSWADYTEEDIQSKKNEVYDQIDQYLAGEKNAGKAVFTEGFLDKINGKSFKYIEIEALEDTTKEGGYLPDSAAANSEIAFSMRYNPAILGATMPSGPYTNSQGGSSVRESVAMQVITHEPERQHILSVYRLIRDFNKWNQAYAKKGLKLEPIIPATILTTLDTGAGTKPVMMGANPGETTQTPTNGTN